VSQSIQTDACGRLLTIVAVLPMSISDSWLANQSQVLTPPSLAGELVQRNVIDGRLRLSAIPFYRPVLLNTPTSIRAGQTDRGRRKIKPVTATPYAPCAYSELGRLADISDRPRRGASLIGDIRTGNGIETFL
jgi:hypothetical protein